MVYPTDRKRAQELHVALSATEAPEGSAYAFGLAWRVRWAAL